VTNFSIRCTSLAFARRRGWLRRTALAQFRYAVGSHVYLRIDMVEEKLSDARMMALTYPGEQKHSRLTSQRMSAVRIHRQNQYNGIGEVHLCCTP
jgi:hypothetical protein